MKRKNATRNALFTSVLALLLCVSMLVGTTFAWFTDEVKSGNNVIAAGNLDVELEYAKVVGGQVSEWKTVKDATDIFDPNALWEPGHVEVAYLKVSNLGSLDLKYQLGVNVASEVGGINVEGKEFKLSDHLVFKTVEMPDALTTYSDREAVAAAAGTEKGLKDYNGKTTALQAKGDNKNSEDYVALIVYMPETVGNEANYRGESVPTINLGVSLFATQVEAEDDSFGNTYDEDAWHPDMTVYTVEELSNALASGGKIQVIGTLNAGATQDVPNWTNAPAEFIFDATTLDALAGGEYVLEQGSRYGIVALISAGESLALSDMNITANSQWPVYLSNYGGSLTIDKMNVTATQGAGIYPYGTNGTTIIKNATVNQKALSDDVAASTPWAGTAIAASNGHNLVIEDGTYYGSTFGVYVYNSGANVTINGGTFKAPQVLRADGVWSGSNKSVITVNGGSFDGQVYLDYGTNPPEIYINGGTFTNFSATVNAGSLVIKGGTFDADPSAYVAAGYKAVEKNGQYVVLPENAIATSDELVAAINKAPDGDTLLLAPGEYSLRFTNNTAFNVDNLKIKGMDNAKLTVSSSEAWYGRVQGDNVTFENIHFTSSVGATGKATYTNCTFDDWTICASSGNKETYFNNCDIKGTLNTSTDFSSGNTYVTDSTVAKAEFSGAATMYFTNCQIGELISWDMATVLENCVVEKQDLKMEDQKVTTIETDENGFSWATDTADPDALVLYEVPSDYAETTLAVPEGVTAIGGYAFANNSNIETIELPSSVTTLNDRAFRDTSASTVVLNEGLTNISYQAFRNALNVTSVEIPSTVTTISKEAFQNSGIKTLEIPDTVDTIEYGGCRDMKELETVTIEGNVDIPIYAFRACTKLTTVVLKGDNVTFGGGTGKGMIFTNKENGDGSAITIYVANETVKERLMAADTAAKDYGGYTIVIGTP